MRRWVLSKKDRRHILNSIKTLYPRLDVEELAKSNIEYLVENDVELVLVNGTPAFILLENSFIPHLKFLLRRHASWLPIVVIDDGAVKPISRGADLMRPGILEIIGKFSKNDIIVIVDPRHKLPLAVHRAIYSSEEVLGMKRGRVAKSIHHVGDKYWRIV